jgi:hypothetical protein
MTMGLDREPNIDRYEQQIARRETQKGVDLSDIPEVSGVRVTADGVPHFDKEAAADAAKEQRHNF